VIKALAIVLTYLGALAVGAENAAAQNRPWCLIQPGLATTCIYYTFEQCLASRVGTTNSCARNPYPEGAPTGIPTIKERRR
jgi:Protein of unknown function (DUF3551)